MTHSQTVSLILDATRSQGVLYHTLTVAQRADIKAQGRAYMRAHATGQATALFEAEARILSMIER